MDALSLGLAFLHVLGWAVYVGGALAMEVLWRPAQEHIPPSQVNVTCQAMGRRYRWLALAALGVIALSGAGRLFESGLVSLHPPVFRPPLVLSQAYGRTILALAVSWTGLVALVSVMAVAAHPALHARTAAEMAPEERKAAREAVRRAIRRMDALLRAELALAFVTLLLGASLHSGGLL